jgi:holin-like protein
MIEAFATLLLYQLIGETLSYTFGLPIPGPVIGMALLLLTFAARPALVAKLRGTGTTLLSHLSLLFVPAGVGVMVHFARLSEEGVAIIGAVVLSTVLTIVATAATAAWLMKRNVAPAAGSIEPSTRPADD